MHIERLKILMESLNWINDRTGANFLSLSEARSGKELIDALVKITGLDQYVSNIRAGTTQQERACNFQTIRKILQEVNEGFPFTIKSLAEGNEQELDKLIHVIMNIEEKYNESKLSENAIDDDELNTIFEQAEGEIQSRVIQQKKLWEEIEDLALERDFYLQKLMTIEELTKQYNQIDVGTIVKALHGDSPDFRRPESSKPANV